MFISRKRFEEAIANARVQGAKETEERIWHEERLRCIEERLYNLEHPNGDKCEKTIKAIGQ